MRRHQVWIVALIVLLGAAAACGVTDAGDSDESGTTSEKSSTTAGPGTTEETTTTTEEETTTTEDGTGDDAVCGPLRDVSDLDKEFTSKLAAGAGWASLQPTLIDLSEQLVDAYDEALAEAPEDLTDAIITLRDFTESFIDVARSSSSLTDFGAKVGSDPKAASAGQAALELDRFARDTCGFSTSNE